MMANPKCKRTSSKAKPASGKVASGKSHTKDTEGVRPTHDTRSRKRKADSCVDEADDAPLNKKNIPDIVKAIMDTMPSSSSRQLLNEVKSNVLPG